MRVLFVQRQPCIRALKYGVGLRAAFPDIELAFAYQGRTLTEYYGSGDELFDGWWPLGEAAAPADELRDAIDAFRPDVIHSHNLPDVLTVLALELAGGEIPVVHDIHDLQRLRRTPYRDGFPEPPDPLALERAAIEGAAAVITVSPELLEVVDTAYLLPARTHIQPNLALRRDLATTLPHRAARAPLRVVYQGSLGTDGGHYDLRDHFRAIAEAGLELHIHGSRPAPEYAALASALPAVYCHDPLDPASLLGVLPAYDLGWAAFNGSLNAAHLDTVLPNKLFEYVGSGLPVVTLRAHRALARFVEEERVGIVLDDVGDLVDAVAAADLYDLRESVARARDRFTFEAAAADVVALYRELIGAPARAAVSPG